MLFKKFRSVPANTTEAAPDWQKLTVAKGVIKQWIIFTDPEAANLLHIRIDYHGSTLIPFGGKDWIEGFFDNTPFFENIELDVPPYVLDIYAYNEDDANPHEYFVHPVIIKEKPISLAVPSESYLDRLRNIFGRS